MKIAFPGRDFASFRTIALILSNSCVCVSLRVTGSPIQTTTPPARLTVSITARDPAPVLRVPGRAREGADRGALGEPRHVVVVVVRAEVEDDDLAAAAPSPASQISWNQLKTSGRVRPGGDVPVDAADRLDHGAPARRPDDRVARA